MPSTQNHELNGQPVPLIPSSTRLLVPNEEEILQWQPAVPRLRLFHPAPPRPFSAFPPNAHNIPSGTLSIATPGSHRPASAAILSWNPAAHLEQDRPASASPTQSRSAQILSKVHALQARAAAAAMPPYHIHSLDSGALIPGAGGPFAAASPNSRSDSPLFVVRRIVSQTGQPLCITTQPTGSPLGCAQGTTPATSSPTATGHITSTTPPATSRPGSYRGGGNLAVPSSSAGGSDDGWHSRQRGSTARGRRSTMPDPTHLRICSKSEVPALPSHRSMEARMSSGDSGGGPSGGGGGSTLAPNSRNNGPPPAPSAGTSSLSLIRQGPSTIAVSSSTADSLPPSVAASSWSLVRLQQHPRGGGGSGGGGGGGFAHRRSSTDIGGLPMGDENDGGGGGAGAVRVRASSSCGGAVAGGMPSISDGGGSAGDGSADGEYVAVVSGVQQQVYSVLGGGNPSCSESNDGGPPDDANGNSGGGSAGARHGGSTAPDADPVCAADAGGVLADDVAARVELQPHDDTECRASEESPQEDNPADPSDQRGGGTGTGQGDQRVDSGGRWNSTAFVTTMDGDELGGPASVPAGWCSDGGVDGATAADTAVTCVDSYAAAAHAAIAAAGAAPEPGAGLVSSAAAVSGSISWPPGSPTAEPLLIAALSVGPHPPTPTLYPLRISVSTPLAGVAAHGPHSQLSATQQGSTVGGGGGGGRPTRPYSTATKHTGPLTPRSASSAVLGSRPQSSNGSGGGPSSFTAANAIAVGALRPTSARPRAGSAVYSAISGTAAAGGGGGSGGGALSSPVPSTAAAAVPIGPSGVLQSAVLSCTALYEIMPDQQASVALTAGAAVPSNGRLGRALADILPTGNPGTFNLSLRERIAMVLKEGPGGPKPAAPQRPEEPTPNPVVIKMLQERQDAEAQRSAVDTAFSSGNPAAWMHQILAADERATGGAGGGGSGSATVTGGTTHPGGSVWGSSSHQGGSFTHTSYHHHHHQQQGRRYQTAAVAGSGGSAGTTPHHYQQQQQQAHHFAGGAGGRRESPKQQHPQHAQHQQHHQHQRASTGGGGGGSWLLGSSCQSPALQSPTHQSVANSRTATGSGSGGGGTSSGSPKRNPMVRHTSAEVLHLQSVSYMASKEACRTLAAGGRVAPGISLRLTALGDGDHGASYGMRRSTGGAVSPLLPSSSPAPSAARGVSAARTGRK